MARNLILIAHQDDEIFCYSYLSHANELAIAFKGGGEPKGEKVEPEKLHLMRSHESLITCEEFGISKMITFDVQRPYDPNFLDAVVKSFFADNEKYDLVITTMPVDFHEDHAALGRVVEKYSTADFTYGFIVHTDTLINYKKEHLPDVKIKLWENDYERKVRLADNYKTQKHFLPNVIKRDIYKTEYYWRLGKRG